MRVNLPQLKRIIIGITLVLVAVEIMGYSLFGFFGLSMDTSILGIIKIKTIIAIILLYSAISIAYNKFIGG